MPAIIKIGIFDIKGITLWSFKHWVTDSRSAQRVLGDPHSIVVTKNGDIIVSDNKADYLDIFDYRGNSLQQDRTRRLRRRRSVPGLVPGARSGWQSLYRNRHRKIRNYQARSQLSAHLKDSARKARSPRFRDYFRALGCSGWQYSCHRCSSGSGPQEIQPDRRISGWIRRPHRRERMTSLCPMASWLPPAAVSGSPISFARWSNA